MRSIFQETGDAEDPTLPFQRRRQKTTHDAVGPEKIITLLLQTIDVLFCRGDPACAGDQENKQLKINFNRSSISGEEHLLGIGKLLPNLSQTLFII